MKLKVFSDNLAQVNTYLLYKNQIAIVIDPGFNGSQILEFCSSKDLKIVAVLLTHGHFDHIKDIQILAKTGPFPLYIGEHDFEMLSNDQYNYAAAFGSRFLLPKLDVVILKNGQVIQIDNETFKVYNTPGHTKGSICIEYGRALFTGDTLFYDSIGRTDLHSGNRNDIQKSIEFLKNKISNDVNIYPGHGNSGKLKAIKDMNPYLK